MAGCANFKIAAACSLAGCFIIASIAVLRNPCLLEPPLPESGNLLLGFQVFSSCSRAAAFSVAFCSSVLLAFSASSNFKALALSSA